MNSRLLAALCLLLSTTSFAQTADVSILIDDRDGTGCTVTPTGLPAFSGIDAQLTATVDRLSAQVTTVELSVCAGGAFGPPSTVGGPHPVGNNNGIGGADVVEMSVLRASVTGSDAGLQVAGLADNGAGVDVTELGIFGTPPTAVPGLGPLGLLVLGLAVLALAGVALKRRRALLSVLLVGLSFAVLATHFMVDGQIGDWTGVPQVASDPLGDGTNGETAVDIVAVFAGQEDQGFGPELFFRVDLADLIIDNQLPVAQDDAVATDEDTALAGDVFADNGSGVDFDPDPDPFTVTMVAGTATVGAPVNLPSGAQVTVNANGTFSYDPLAAFNSLSQGGSAIDTFTYTIDDGIAGSDQATVTVTVAGINDVGTAVDDTYGTAEDTPLIVGAPGVLGNDTDPDTADTRTAVLDAGPSSALSFTLNADGSFNYTPVLNFTGADTFTYHANDGLADTNMATVTINVGAVNDPPVAMDDSGDATDEDTPITTQDVRVNDSDPEMDPLSVSAFDAMSAMGATITDNGGGTFGYDPNTSATLNALAVGEMTTDTFGYTVTDGFLTDTATVSVTVTGVNDPMTAVDDSGAGFATDEDTLFTTGNVLANDTDPDAADILSVMSADATSAQGAAITDNGNGTFDYDPTGAAALQALAAGAMLTDTFSYTGTDGNGSTDMATVSIEVTGVNDDPVIGFPSGAATFNNTGPVNIDPIATLTDLDSPDFDTGDLTASLALSADTSMCDGNDILTVENQGVAAGEIGFDGMNVSFGGTQFGTVTTNYLCMDMGGGVFGVVDPLLIAFDPNASQAAVTALLQALQYNTTSMDDQDREASAMVTDGDGGTSNAALATITVNLNQPPTAMDDTFSIDENSADGTSVGTVVASDPDAGQTLSYAITAGNTNTTFAINASTGEITLNDPPGVDFEGGPATFNLTVTVTDDGTPMLNDTAAITVNVNDVNEPPTATDDTFSIDENSADGTSVGTVMATDPDAGQTLSYAITAGNTNTTFAINSLTGAITLNDPPGVDFETPPTTFNLTVTVTDDGTGMLSDTAAITVNVNDVNEPPTATDDTFSIDENSADGTAVGTVVASDPDAGQTLSYAITAGNTNTTFAINSATGAITLNTPPGVDFEGGTNVFNLTVTVTDDGTPMLNDTAAITVNVNDVNEPPTATDDTFSIDENSADGTSVGTVAASDPDVGQTLSYAITAGNTNTTFAINSATGAITLNTPPGVDFEGGTNVFNLTVTVTDDGTGMLSDTAAITVNVNDVNEPPTAMDETFAAQSNVGIAPNAMNGLLANDTDVDAGDSVSLAAASVGTFATTAGGSITTMMDGSFTYSPQAGVAGVMDTFVYTVQDLGGLTDTATVTFNVDSNTIWFVDLDAGTMGDGTLGNPFDSLADLDNGGPDANGHTIFHYTSTMGAQTDALSDDFDLQDNQLLIGEGATGMGTINDLRGFTTHPFSLTLPSIGAAANHTVTSTGVSGIQLASGNTIRGLDVGNTGAGPGIVGFNFGTLTIDDVTINGTGRILDLDTGTVTDPTGGDFTFGSLASTSNPGIAIDLNAVGGGFTVDTTTSITGGVFGIELDNTPAATSFDFGTTIIGGGTDAGIDIATSGSATFTFDSLSVTNDSGTGVLANNGGTVNVGGAMNTINSTGGPGIHLTSTSLGGGATFSSVSSTNSGGDGINLDSVTGSLTINGGSILGAAGIAFDVNAGSSNVTYAGSITNTANRSVEVTNRMGGTMTFQTGTITDTSASGIRIASNGSGAINFNGNVDVTNSTGAAVTVENHTGGSTTFANLDIDNSTSNQVGLFATNNAGAHTLNVTTGTVDAGNNTAVDVDNTILGVNLVRLDSVGGGAVGIDLLDTTGSFTVAGDGSNAQNGSGGTIGTKTGRGVRANRATNISLSSMNITNTGDDGLFLGGTAAGDFVTGFTLRGGFLSANGNAVGEHGMELRDLHGTVLIDNTRITNAGEHGVQYFNDSGTISSLTLSASEIDNHAAGVGFNFELQSGAGNPNLTTGMASSNNVHDNFATGLFFVNNGGGTLGGAGTPFVISGNTLTGNNIGLDVSAGPASNVTRFSVVNNTTITGHSSHAMNFFSADTAGNTSTNVFEGTIQGNVIGGAGAGSGSAIGNGIRVNMNDPVDAAIRIANNIVSDVAFGRGIEVIGRLGAGNTGVTLTANMVTAVTLAGIYVESNDGHTICANISGNTSSGGTAGIFPPFHFFGGDFAMTQGTLGGGSTHQLEGGGTDCSGSPCANATAQVTATNTAVNGIVDEFSDATFMLVNVIGIVPPMTCDTP